LTGALAAAVFGATAEDTTAAGEITFLGCLGFLASRLPRIVLFANMFPLICRSRKRQPYHAVWAHLVTLSRFISAFRNISFATGWESLRTFGRTFHGITGQSPSALRLEAQANMPQLDRVAAGGLNRSMQHTRDRASCGRVADETNVRSGMPSSPSAKEYSRKPHESLHVVSIDGPRNASSAPVAHQFPAIAMVHPLEFPPPRHFAPIVNGNQQHGHAQPTQAHDDSCPRFDHGTLLDCETDQAVRVIRRSGYERQPSETSVRHR
jgi:hypothetical protein